MQDVSNFGDACLCNISDGQNLVNSNLTVNTQGVIDAEFWYTWYKVYPYLATQQQVELLAAPIMWQVNDYINGVFNGSSSLQFVTMLGDEITLMTLLTALNITSPGCLLANWNADRDSRATPYNSNCVFPQFSSQVIFEFYNTSNPYVRVLYNDNPQSLSMVSDVNITLSDFTTKVYTYATGGQGIAQYINNCGLESTITAYSIISNSIVIPIVLGAMAVLLTITLIILIKKKNKLDALINDVSQGNYVEQKA
jgi:hypothetical protein